MHRRSIFLSLAALAMVPAAAMAAPEAAKPPEETWVTMTGVGLPIIVDGRVINHVFVELKLHLKTGHPLEAVRAKDAFMRDALVRAGHQTPFVLSDDWNRINSRTLSAALIRIANQQVGTGVVTRVEIVRQTPRVRVRNPVPAPAAALTR